MGKKPECKKRGIRKSSFSASLPAQPSGITLPCSAAVVWDLSLVQTPVVLTLNTPPLSWSLVSPCDWWDLKGQTFSGSSASLTIMARSATCLADSLAARKARPTTRFQTSTAEMRTLLSRTPASLAGRIPTVDDVHMMFTK